MHEHKISIRKKVPQIYSQDLINNLFRNPYTKINLLSNELQVNYLTARKYLDVLTELGFLEKMKIGKSNCYINIALIEVLINKQHIKKELKAVNFYLLFCTTFGAVCF